MMSEEHKNQNLENTKQDLSRCREAHTRRSFRCTHTPISGADKALDRNLDLSRNQIDTSGWAFKGMSVLLCLCDK